MQKYFKMISIFLAIDFLFAGILFAEEIYVDGVIIAVFDLRDATEAYKDIGFTIKAGHMHKNGLLNAHIKLPNKTSIELMSVVGNATDDIAKKYLSILKRHGESGAYLSLSGVSADEFSSKMNSLGLEHEIIRGQNWDYVTFPEHSGLEHIFLFSPHKEFKNETWVYIHKNGASRINQVWIEGGRRVETLLKGLNMSYCGKEKYGPDAEGKLYKSSLGNIVIVPAKSDERPRILGVSIEMKEESKQVFVNAEDAHGIWIDNNKRSDNCDGT